jgi:hypothetical protein
MLSGFLVTIHSQCGFTLTKLFHQNWKERNGDSKDETNQDTEMLQFEVPPPYLKMLRQEYQDCHRH